MAYPTMEISGRTIIVLGDIDEIIAAEEKSEKQAMCEIRAMARQHPDAVAFGYAAGRWVPAA